MTLNLLGGPLSMLVFALIAAVACEAAPSRRPHEQPITNLITTAIPEESLAVGIGCGVGIFLVLSFYGVQYLLNRRRKTR